MIIERRPVEWARLYRSARENQGTARFSTHLTPPQISYYVGSVRSLGDTQYEIHFNNACAKRMLALFNLLARQIREGGEITYHRPDRPIERLLFDRMKRVLEMPDKISIEADLDLVREEFGF